MELIFKTNGTSTRYCVLMGFSYLLTASLEWPRAPTAAQFSAVEINRSSKQFLLTNSQASIGGHKLALGRGQYLGHISSRGTCSPSLGSKANLYA